MFMGTSEGGLYATLNDDDTNPTVTFRYFDRDELFTMHRATLSGTQTTNSKRGGTMSNFTPFHKERKTLPQYSRSVIHKTQIWQNGSWRVNRIPEKTINLQGENKNTLTSYRPTPYCEGTYSARVSCRKVVPLPVCDVNCTESYRNCHYQWFRFRLWRAMHGIVPQLSLSVGSHYRKFTSYEHNASHCIVNVNNWKIEYIKLAITPSLVNLKFDSITHYRANRPIFC